MIVDQHELRVTSGSTELEPLEPAGTITLDRSWTPFIQGTLNVRPPEDFGDTEPGSVVTVELTQRFGDVAFVSDLTDLWCGPGRTLAELTAEVCGAGRDLDDLTAETITAGSWNTPVRAGTGRTLELVVTGRTRSRDEHRLEVASREADIIDLLYFNSDVSDNDVPYQPTSTNLLALAREIIPTERYQNDPGAPADPVVILDAAPYAEIPPALLTPLTSGTSYWDYLQPFMNNARQRILSRGDSALLVAPVEAAFGEPFEIAHGVNLIDWQVSDERRQNVGVRFQGTETDPDARPIFSTIAGLNPAPVRTFLDLNRPYAMWPPAGEIVTTDQTPATPYAEQIGLDKSPVRLVTINDYSLEPNRSITYTLPDEAEQDDIIDSISWQLGGQWESDIWV